MRRFDKITPGRIKKFSGTAKAYRRALPFIKKRSSLKAARDAFAGRRLQSSAEYTLLLKGVMRRRLARLRKGLTRPFLFLQTAAIAQPFPFGRKKPHAFLKYSVDKCAEK